MGKFIRRRQKLNLTEAQLSVLDSFQLRTQTIEVTDPDGKRVRVKVQVKKYPTIKELPVKVKDLVPTANRFDWGNG